MTKDHISVGCGLLHILADQIFDVRLFLRLAVDVVDQLFFGRGKVEGESGELLLILLDGFLFGFRSHRHLPRL